MNACAGAATNATVATNAALTICEISPRAVFTSPACGGGRIASTDAIRERVRASWGLSRAETPSPQPSPASGGGGVAPSRWQLELISQNSLQLAFALRAIVAERVELGDLVQKSLLRRN